MPQPAQPPSAHPNLYKILCDAQVQTEAPVTPLVHPHLSLYFETVLDLVSAGIPSRHLALYHKAWNKRPEDFFNKVLVDTKKDRSDLDLSAQDLPDSCLVWMDKLIVRGEFVQFLKDIIQSQDTGRPSRTVDHASTAGATDSPSDHLLVTPTEIEGLIRLARMPNERIVAGVELLGQSGIGKSTCLEFILALRCLASLQTVLVIDPEVLFVFCEEGVYSCRYTQGSDFAKGLETDAWILIDGDDKLGEGIPAALEDASRFLIYAASPRISRMKSSSDLGISLVRWYMKPWTLPELVVGLPYRRCPVTEEQLCGFLKDFTPSARHAYGLAQNLDGFRKECELQIRALTTEQIASALTIVPQINLVGAGIPFLIFCISPGPFRSEGSVEYCSKFIVEQLLARYEISTDIERLKLYDVFVDLPETRASAGRIFEFLAHLHFTRGGQWQLTPMRKTRNSVSTYHSSTGSRFLTLGGNCDPSIEDLSLGEDIVRGLQPMDRVQYSGSVSAQDLKNAYYVPVSRTNTSFDAFVFNPESKRVTVFQITVGSKHDAKATGFSWLDTCSGVDAIDYVLVSPRSAAEATAPSVVFDKDSTVRKVKNRYYLELSKGMLRGRGVEGRPT